ncbi:MAG: tryptophan--tRNA ligase [Deltaproteobacteria bacterium]|nr:tryptophan--tRNA ligase [Deltaproteobacteria bacterium]
MSAKSEKRSVIVSGMRPTGRLHLGHLLGTLGNWVQLQERHECFFFVADWHVLTTDYEKPQSISDFSREMVIDWLAAGLDPERSVIFRQSALLEHAELALLFGMLTPLGWLERNPTYKEQREQLGDRDLSTFGFLGYPVLQAADILLYKASGVPVGIDQVPHVELTREIARRFNNYYGEVFPEPQALLSPAPKIPGTDGRKMSKSYGNAIFLDEDPASIEKRLGRMATDPARVRRTDPGDPALCPAFLLHQIYCTPEEIAYVTEGCRTAGIGCLDCKKVMIRHVLEQLAPLRERRAEIVAKPGLVDEILAAGAERARKIARETMREVREAIGM